MQQLRTYFPYLIVAVFLLTVFWWCKDFPVFGDGLHSVSIPAVHIYEEGLATIFTIEKHDPGHPTLIPYLLALLWTITGGPSLWMGHLLMLGFAVLCFHYLKKLSEAIELPTRLLPVFFVIHPYLLAQVSNLSLQLPLTAFFFAALYFLIKGRRWTTIVFASLMMLTHLQGSLLLLNLALLDFFLLRNTSIFLWIRSRFLVFAVPFLVFIVWGILHYQYTGWAYSTPHWKRGMPGIAGFFYNLALSVWRINDYLLFIPVLFSVWMIYRHKLAGNNVKLVYVHAIIFIVSISALFSFPPAHRYFLSITLLFIPLVEMAIDELNMKVRNIAVIIVFLSLFFSGFMYIPGKCIGDSNLAYLKYLDLEKQLTLQYGRNEVFYTYAPLNYAAKYRYLKADGEVLYGDLYQADPDTVKYVLQSCMTCEFDREKEKVFKDWHANAIVSGGIFYTVYANPKYVKPDSSWKKRTPGKVESWIESLKQKVK